jgi:hypothetical protein
MTWTHVAAHTRLVASPIVLFQRPSVAHLLLLTRLVGCWRQLTHLGPSTPSPNIDSLRRFATLHHVSFHLSDPNVSLPNGRCRHRDLDIPGKPKTSPVKTLCTVAYSHPIPPASRPPQNKPSTASSPPRTHLPLSTARTTPSS